MIELFQYWDVIYHKSFHWQLNKYTYTIISHFELFVYRCMNSKPDK